MDLLDDYKLYPSLLLHNMKNLQILTDESCNYKFYEKLGCKKVYETIVKNKEIGQLGNEYTEKAFIYVKKLQKNYYRLNLIQDKNSRTLIGQ